MNDYIFGCPLCQQQFKVLADFAGGVVQCPACHQKIRIPENLTRADELSPALPSLSLPTFEVTEPVPKRAIETPKEETDRDAQPSPDLATRSKVDHLLPPRFEVFDPTRIRERRTEDTKIYLPTAEGGLQTIDDRLVTIHYKGQKYTVVAMSPAEKQRRQIVINLISIVIAIAAIYGTICILLK